MKSSTRRKAMDFVAIREGGRYGGQIALAIYPPGTWFDSKEFTIFVGGCGVGRRRTLAAAKKRLLELAVGECNKRIDEAQAEIDHYRRERAVLGTFGLRRLHEKARRQTRKSRS